MNTMKKRSNQFLAVAALGLVCLAGSGCSTFNLDWDAARALPRQPADLTGRWEGTWKSDSNGHTDKLRCLVTKTDAGQYEARFHALYKRVVTLTFGYTVPLAVQESEPCKWTFQGEAELGWYAGGHYTYNGQATTTNFFSLYDSKYDRGSFVLTRPVE